MINATNLQLSESLRLWIANVTGLNRLPDDIEQFSTDDYDTVLALLEFHCNRMDTAHEVQSIMDAIFGTMPDEDDVIPEQLPDIDENHDWLGRRYVENGERFIDASDADLALLNFSRVTFADYLFHGNADMSVVPDTINYSKLTSAKSMFNSVTNVSFWPKMVFDNCTDFRSMFHGDNVSKANERNVLINITINWKGESTIIDCSYMFSNRAGLEGEGSGLFLTFNLENDTIAASHNMFKNASMNVIDLFVKSGILANQLTTSTLIASDINPWGYAFRNCTANGLTILGSGDAGYIIYGSEDFADCNIKLISINISNILPNPIALMETYNAFGLFTSAYAEYFSIDAYTTKTTGYASNLAITHRMLTINTGLNAAELHWYINNIGGLNKADASINQWFYLSDLPNAAKLSDESIIYMLSNTYDRVAAGLTDSFFLGFHSKTYDRNSDIGKRMLTAIQIATNRGITVLGLNFIN